MPNIILGCTRTYIRLYRKVGLLSRTEKRYLWLAELNFRNCLSIIYMYTQRWAFIMVNIRAAFRGCGWNRVPQLQNFYIFKRLFFFFFLLPVRQGVFVFGSFFMGRGSQNCTPFVSDHASSPAPLWLPVDGNWYSRDFVDHPVYHRPRFWKRLLLQKFDGQKVPGYEENLSTMHRGTKKKAIDYLWVGGGEGREDRGFFWGKNGDRRKDNNKFLNNTGEYKSCGKSKGGSLAFSY